MPLLGVQLIVEDVQSTPDARLCTGVAQYRDATIHITYTAVWNDSKHSSFDVNAHATTDAEAEGRAVSLRIDTHPPGRDGTFLVSLGLPFCTDADFAQQAERELREGIAYRRAFYREAQYRILGVTENGYGAGLGTNCIVTVGDDRNKGAVFIGTNDVPASQGQRFQFYILSPGPEGFALKNRLWEIGSE